MQRLIQQFRAFTTLQQTSNNVICEREGDLVTLARHVLIGGLPERPMGADCKSAGSAFSGSNPLPTTSTFLKASEPASITCSQLIESPSNCDGYSHFFFT